MNVWALFTVEAGIDTLDALLPDVAIAGVIGLTPRDPGDAISGYVDAAAAAADRDLPFVGVAKYAMDGPDDRTRLEALDIDVLLVLGWQRLVPEWLIEHTRIAVLGGHGSADGITAGRGRSPQNWALMLGCDAFHLALFRITPGIDDGPVIASCTFPYTDRDDIRSSYLKVCWHHARMVRDALALGPDLATAGTPQDASAARYLPARRPEDGAIDWTRPTADIDRFVRALAPPYPGAFTAVEVGRVARVARIRRARPFVLGDDAGHDGGDDTGRDRNEAPGTIERAFHGGGFVVRTGDGRLLVDDAVWSDADGNEVAPPSPRAVTGCRCAAASWSDQLDGILERHRAKWSQLPLSELVLDAARR